MIEVWAAAIVTAILGRQPLRRALDAYLEWWKWHYRIEGGIYVGLALLGLLGLYLLFVAGRSKT